MADSCAIDRIRRGDEHLDRVSLPAYPNPLAALLGCIAFATNGAYLAFFHSTRLVLGNFVVAAAVGSPKRRGWPVDGHIALAAVDLWLVAQINIAMPLAIHFLVRALGNDLSAQTWTRSPGCSTGGRFTTGHRAC